jgi:uncharacterized membrane-anchored protein
MTQAKVQDVLRAAIHERLLPAGATLPAAEGLRPWPVVLLTALGAWLAAIPLLGVVGMLLGDLISRGTGAYVVGALLLAGALVVLRSREMPLFVEQLAVPLLLVGGGSLGFGLFKDLGAQGGALVLALVALGVGAAVRAAWLRVLLGAAAAALFVLALAPKRWDVEWATAAARWWWPWHAVLAAWLVATATLVGVRASQASAAAESLATGWLLTTLAGLALWSGMTFLVGASTGGGFAGEVAREVFSLHTARRMLGARHAISALLALAAIAWAARRWPGLRAPQWIGVGAVLVVISAFMPTLGAVWLVLAVCATASRWRLAVAAGLAAAWIVGAFYYQLAWPLGTKALVLACAGAVLGALAWWGRPAAPATATATAAAAPAPRFAAWGLGASLVLTLAVANGAIWQKEQLIARGQPVYVELAPVDPRSLMQGDYMRLNFNLPFDRQLEMQELLRAQRPHAIARRDARGVATLLRIDSGAPLAADEMRIELTPKGGRWILVSDAWFFAEGEAERWAKAKYGEFRVEPGGRALLVGLKGPNLEPL